MAWAIIRRRVRVWDLPSSKAIGTRRQEPVEFLADPTSGESAHRVQRGYAAGGPSPGSHLDRLTRRHPRMVFDVVTWSGAAGSHRDPAERRVELSDCSDCRCCCRSRRLGGRKSVRRRHESRWRHRAKPVGRGGGGSTLPGTCVNRTLDLLPVARCGVSAHSPADAFRARGLKATGRDRCHRHSMHMQDRLLATGLLPTTIPLAGLH